MNKTLPSLNDISYKLYYYTKNEGTTISPKRPDSILTKYSGMTLDSIVFDLFLFKNKVSLFLYKVEYV